MIFLMFQIELDFQYLFEESNFNLLVNWQSFFETVIKFSDTSKIRDQEARDFLEIIDNDQSEGKYSCN